MASQTQIVSRQLVGGRYEIQEFATRFGDSEWFAIDLKAQASKRHQRHAVVMQGSEDACRRRVAELVAISYFGPQTY